VRGCWGTEEWKKIKDNPVLCSGTTIGTKKGVMRYLNVMLAEMEKLRNTKPGISVIGGAEQHSYRRLTCCRAPAGCRAYGIDQGYHNYLFYNNRFGSPEQIKVWKQGEGPINTVGYVCQREGPQHSLTDRLIQNKDHFVMNDNGKKSATIHQWNRCWDQLVHFVGSPATMDEKE
jgi:hypothetical protein